MTASFPCSACSRMVCMDICLNWSSARRYAGNWFQIGHAVNDVFHVVRRIHHPGGGIRDVYYPWIV